MFIARVSMEPTSETLAGSTRVLLVLASSRTCVMYCSATRAIATLRTLGDLRDSATLRSPSAVGAGDGHNGGRRTFGLVDLLLLLGFRRFDDLLLRLRLIDGGVAFAFGGQNHRTFSPARRASVFHGGQDIFRRVMF